MSAFILFLASSVLLQLLPVRADLNEYLDEKLRQSKIEIIKIYIQETSPDRNKLVLEQKHKPLEHMEPLMSPWKKLLQQCFNAVQEKSYKLHWDRSWRVSLTREYQPFTISTFDGILVLDGNRVMAPSLSETSWNQTHEPLRQIDQVGGFLSVKFVKSIVWKDSDYLLICYKPALCSLYTRTLREPLRFRQTIGYKGTPVDAAFFTQADQLYLVIVNNADKFSVPSVIYRWSGTYMDVVDEVMTIGATSVTTFEHRQSTIIVFAQNDDENPRVGSEVYEFKGNTVRIQVLATARPTSMHHYVHGDFNFVLMVNELGPSTVFCWDGRELLDWFSLPEIKPRSLINIFHMDGDTFIVVAHNNIIELFKFHSTSDWKSEDTKRLKDEQKIVDVAVTVDEYMMSVILVVQEKDTFFVEDWKAKITSVPSESKVEGTKRECLSVLIEALQARMPAIKEAEASQRLLLPSAKNVTVSEPLKLDNLTLKSGTVRSIEIAAEEDVLPLHEIEKALDDLADRVRGVEAAGQSLLKKETETIRNMLNRITQDTVTLGDVHLEELMIDRVTVYNVNDMQPETLSPGEQNFTGSLCADELTVRNLHVDSLCGIPSQYWTLRNNGDLALAIANSSVEYSSDAVIVRSDLTVPHLNVKSLNGTIIDELIGDLFIVNRSQKINGTVTYKNTLQITNLSTTTLNGVPADQIMTRTTNQSFDSFYIRILDIVNLYADTVNGVPVEEAARKSQENIVIKTPVHLANLRVTENLVIDANASQIPTTDLRPLQIYKNVTLKGDLHVRNIRIGGTAALYMGDIPVNVTDMFDNFWTKSGDQTITEGITFEGGITTDRLNTKYLNGFEESDFLYTTAKEIPSEFANLHFEDLHADEFFREDGPRVSFFQVEPDLLTIREKVYVEKLTATDITTLAFNGISIDDIMNGTPVAITELPAVRARRVFVDSLDVRFLNDREICFGNGLRAGDALHEDTLKTSKFRARSLEVEELNGIKMDLLTRMRDLSSPLNMSIIVDGDLTVGNLAVARVGGQSTESFLQELARNDIVMISEKNIKDLTVQNIMLESLCGQKLDDLIAGTLSKSRDQAVPGNFSARVVTSDNVTINFINGKNTSELIWVDKPFVIMGNVTFSDLFVEGDVITSKMNGRKVEELYESLLFIPAKSIDSLIVDGSLSWDVPSTGPASVSYLLENAVTKDGDQVIKSKVTFARDVHAWAVTGSFNEINQIRDIVSDAVIDNGEPVEITGRKFFESDFVASSLTASGDLGLARINDVNILEFNNSVVRKNREDTIAGPLVFRADVTIERLRVNDADFSASIGAATRANDVMPDNIFFEDLEVRGDVHLERLNGTNFTDFARNRVTLSEDHDIECNVKFNGVVTVTGNANVKKINNIPSSDFVLDNADKPQLISDVKTFEEDLVVDGDVTAPRINDANLIDEYNDGVKNGQDVDIFGDLIFKADVRIRSMNTSGLTNGMNMRTVIDDSKAAINETVRQLEERWKTIGENMQYISQVSKTLPTIVYYLELDVELTIPGNNVSKVDVAHLNASTIRLYAHSEQSGKFCGLPDDCPCSYQTVIDLIDKKAVRSRRTKSGESVRHFFDVNVNAVSNTVSSSEKCTTAKIEEFTTISPAGSRNFTDISENAPDKIEGYLSDAERFTRDGDVYLVLAIYYDKARATHRTSSLVYKIDAAAGNATLVQEIPTDGAWSISIFEIDHQVLLLIGCVGKSSTSLLFRFNLATQKFEDLRTFESKSRYVKNLSQEEDHFVLLDNPQTNAVNIYKYNATSRNFDFYQGIFHVHPVTGIECFYTDEIGNSDMFAIVTTQGGRFYIYEYMFAGKFQMKLQHTVDGLQTMVPFHYMGRHYIFAGTSSNTTIFRIVKQPH